MSSRARVRVDVFETRAQLVDRSEESLHAAIQDQDVRAQVLDHRQHVRADDDRGALRGALSQRPLEDANSLRVEAGERLVEQDRLRIVQVAAADGQLLPHAAREVAGRRVEFRGQLELVEQREGLGAGIGDSVDARVEREVLFDGQVGKQRRIVGHEGESRLGRDRVGVDVEAGDRQPPAAGRNDAGQRPHRGRLAGAVGSDERQQLARLDAKRNAAHGDVVGERLVKIVDFDHGRFLAAKTRLGRSMRSKKRPRFDPREVYFVAAR